MVVDGLDEQLPALRPGCARVLRPQLTRRRNNRVVANYRKDLMREWVLNSTAQMPRLPTFSEPSSEPRMFCISSAMIKLCAWRGEGVNN